MRAEEPDQTNPLLNLFVPPPNTAQKLEKDGDEQGEKLKAAQTAASQRIPIPVNHQTVSDESRDVISPYEEASSSSPSKASLHTKAPSLGSNNHFMNLFAPQSNREADSQESTPLIAESSVVPGYSLDSVASHWKQSGLPPTPSRASDNNASLPTYQSFPQSMATKRLSGTMPSIQESIASSGSSSSQGKLWTTLSTCTKEATKGTTLIGSFMYLLYHIVFCLALGSAIIRPNNPTSILGLMAKMSALGTICSSFVYWLTLNSEVPALYPTVDLFLAPFLAHLAVIIDQTLADDPDVTHAENDTLFLTTFAILSAIGTCFSASLLMLSSVFRLANLGSFLPFPVICGFFVAVGILMWTLAIKVDTGGTSINTILSSGDMDLVSYAVIHHIPSVTIAGVMKYLGPKNPFYVIMIVISSVGLFYATMFAMGVSLEEAREDGWFWSHDELVYKSAVPVSYIDLYGVRWSRIRAFISSIVVYIFSSEKIGFYAWVPPAPFGSLNMLFQGKVHWGAVQNGLSTAIAMGFLYVIRCSVHGTALKKNIPNLSRKAKSNEHKKITPKPVQSPKLPPMRPKPVKSRKFSEAVDIETVMSTPNGNQDEAQRLITAKPTNVTLNDILLPYAYNQFVSALVGGFPITPAVAASTTMFSLGAEGLAPQIGSVLLLVIFYLTDFQLVGYIPKPAFSSMIILAFIDMMYTWLYKSYFKTKDKLEWLVVPIIVIAAFVLDLLTAVFLGIAISTFLFVAAFFRSGVVKYTANGIKIHSTIERPFNSSEWLNHNGDLIQVLVLQNYLFFGNATTVYNSIQALFQSDDSVTGENGEESPNFMILDMTLVTGLDTSTVDIFNDIKNLCASNNCKLLMAGIPSDIRTIFALGGFKADTAGERSKRQVRFFRSLDAALGKAEDILLERKFDQTENASAYGHRRLLSEGDNGLRSALRQIDEQHEERFAVDLLPLQQFTRVIELKSGDHLYSHADDIERGLFFIESGVIKVEHSTDATINRGTLRGSSSGSIGALGPRIGPSSPLDSSENPQTFRLARIGPGWVAGTLEYVSGIRCGGDHVAVTDCRLHHMPYSRLQEIEKENPPLVLSLYKLLSFLMARRQEATIGQLATLHSIMTSPAKSHPLRRRISEKK